MFAAAASPKKTVAASIRLHHRWVSPLLVGLNNVWSGGEPDLWVQILLE
jgi:hypothetical protein